MVTAGAAPGLVRCRKWARVAFARASVAATFCSRVMPAATPRLAPIGAGQARCGGGTDWPLGAAASSMSRRRLRPDAGWVGTDCTPDGMDESDVKECVWLPMESLLPLRERGRGGSAEAGGAAAAGAESACGCNSDSGRCGAPEGGPEGGSGPPREWLLRLLCCDRPAPASASGPAWAEGSEGALAEFASSRSAEADMPGGAGGGLPLLMAKEAPCSQVAWDLGRTHRG